VNQSCPAILIAGVSSGVGKTSLTLGIVRALARRGLRVQTFKVGPDFLDPSYLALASGRPCYNLDGWMTSREYVRQLFARATADADFAVIEGVMGLFDGASPTGLEGSSAEIALWLDAPVVLVANAHGMARSLAAVVKGFAVLEPALRLAGVIANQSGSERHRNWLAESLSSAGLPPLLGAVPRGALPTLQGRHLGLVTADSGLLPEETINQFADACEKYLCGMGILPMSGCGMGILPMSGCGTGILPVSGPSQRQDPGKMPMPQAISPHVDERPILKRQGANLPHWTKVGSTYAVCFRLGDSVPARVLDKWQMERQEIVQRAKMQNRELTTIEIVELNQLYCDRIEAYLHAGHGACYMKDPRIAELVQNSLLHFDGDRYELFAWAIMPNHVHAVLRPLGTHGIVDILHSWKSFTALGTNRVLGRKGKFWQEEYYDHLIRNEVDFVREVNYVTDNPQKAGLRDWRWVGRMSTDSSQQQQQQQQLQDMGRMPMLQKDTGKMPVPHTRIGIARDAAFHFYYPDNLEMLAGLGAELVEFSPLGDQHLPPDLGGLYFGGGYPELHAAALSANQTMLQDVRRHVADGKALYAECGGLMYLGQALTTPDGARVAMAGVLPIETAMLGKLKSLGYVQAEAAPGTIWNPTGSAGAAVLRGHEFHYSEIASDRAAAEGWQSAYATKRRNQQAGPEGYFKGSVLASYIHVHLASCPEAARHFVELCGTQQ
jgi:cobyrinic acid a,c-diamide synthase/REP element-mobilizing transposase RayT